MYHPSPGGGRDPSNPMPIQAEPPAPGRQPALLNLHDLVPTLKPESTGVDAAERKRLWLQVRQSLLSLRDTITSEWETHRSRPEELDFHRMEEELNNAKKVAAESIFNMDKFLATAEGIIGSLKKLVAKGTSLVQKRLGEERRKASDAVESSPSEEKCALKEVRRELDQVKTSRDKLMQELTSLASKKKRLEEEFRKVREEISITKEELSKAEY